MLKNRKVIPSHEMKKIILNNLYRNMRAEGYSKEECKATVRAFDKATHISDCVRIDFE